MMPQTWPGSATSLTLHTESRDFQVGVRKEPAERGHDHIPHVMILGDSLTPRVAMIMELRLHFSL